jgi:hypothetical protein
MTFNNLKLLAGSAVLALAALRRRAPDARQGRGDSR